MIESTIFNNLIYNEEYARKTLPFLKEAYFQNKIDKTLYGLIDQYVNKYNSIPSKAALLVDASNISGINDDEYNSLKEKIELLKDEPVSLDWLIDQTEKHCQDKAIYNAIMDSIQIINGSSQASKVPFRGFFPRITFTLFFLA